MEITNSFNNINTLNQILDELKFLLSQMNANDLRKIFLNLALETVKETYYNKKNILYGFARSVNKKLELTKSEDLKMQWWMILMD